MRRFIEVSYLRRIGYDSLWSPHAPARGVVINFVVARHISEPEAAIKLS
jgi:hypothetical protein